MARRGIHGTITRIIPELGVLVTTPLPDVDVTQYVFTKWQSSNLRREVLSFTNNETEAQIVINPQDIQYFTIGKSIFMLGIEEASSSGCGCGS